MIRRWASSAVCLYGDPMVYLIRGLVLLIAFAALPALGHDVSVTKHTAPPPDEIAAPVKALLAPGGATAKVGANTIEFWWVASLDATGKDWSAVAEGTLVGAMKVSAPFRDIRGRSMKAGTYLLRCALQPQNGDHLGVSPHREFLLATPAAEDTSPGPLGHDPAVDLAKKSINISHPAVLSLDPPVSTGAPLAVTATDAGHTAVVFEVPVAGGSLKFGLVLVGLIEA
jgi:hypothetical protein